MDKPNKTMMPVRFSRMLKNIYWIKVLLLLLRICPARELLMSVTGAVYSLPFMLIGHRDWASIRWFAGHLGLQEKGGRFVRKYYREIYRNALFPYLMAESPGQMITPDLTRELDKVLSAEGREKGILFLCAHIGPQFVMSYLLASRCLPIRPYISTTALEVVRKQNAIRSPDYRGKLIRFRGKLDYLPVGSELALVRHLKQGGIVTFANDMPLRPGSRGGNHSFLGRQVRFSLFPFRIACDLGIPVWYFTVKKKPAVGFYMEITKLHFETPAEGLSRYVKLAEADILAAPAAWHFVPGFRNWPHEPCT